MDQWKEKLLAAQLKRDRAKRAYVRKQQAAMLQQTAHTSEALKYTEKLKELADARPGIWRTLQQLTPTTSIYIDIKRFVFTFFIIFFYF